MIATSAHFGQMEVDEASVIEFPEGLPGFEDRRRFIPLERADQPGLVFLQSEEKPGLCFLALPVRALRNDYEVVMSADDLETVGLPPGSVPRIGQNVIALALISVAEGEPATANLRSPVVIHMQTRRAVQAIRPDDRYQCREPLLAPERCEAVCS